MKKTLYFVVEDLHADMIISDDGKTRKVLFSQVKNDSTDLDKAMGGFNPASKDEKVRAAQAAKNYLRKIKSDEGWKVMEDTAAHLTKGLKVIAKIETEFPDKK